MVLYSRGIESGNKIAVKTPANAREKLLTALESVLKPSKQPNKATTGKTDNSVKIECFLLMPGGKTAVVFQLEEKVFHQMTLFVRVPVCFPGVFGSDTAGNHHDSALFFQPAYKFIAVIAFIRQNEFAV